MPRRDDMRDAMRDNPVLPLPAPARISSGPSVLLILHHAGTAPN
jgi:hypothetical protein